MINKPNFFIAGMPKAGTTALHFYLSQHRNIFMSDPKEPHYWSGADLPGLGNCKSYDDYISLFRNTCELHIAVGEASALSLFSETAIKKINEYDSSSKIIVLIRNPIDQAYSFHSQLFFVGNEDVPNFETAWRLQKKRSLGKNLPKQVFEPKLLQYGEVAKSGKQLQRLFRIFPKSQIKIILFEDFIRDTRQTYIKILNFLSVPHDGRTEFQKINENKQHLWTGLGHFLCQPPQYLVKMHKTFKKIVGIKQTNFKTAFAKKTKRKALDPAFRSELQDFFLEDVELSEHLLEKDLPHWKR